MTSCACLMALGLLFQGLDSRGMRQTKPLADYVSLTISADRDTYYRGELLKLTVTAENTSQVPITAHFDFAPTFGQASVLYRVGTAPFTKLDLKPWRKRTALLAPSEHSLKPGEKYTYEIPISLTSVLAPPARSFALDQTGRYELQVKYVDTFPDDPNGLLDSNVLRIDVVPAPGHERSAQAAYTPNLAYVAQLGWGHGTLTPQEVQEAADFIQKFPESRYTVSVKHGLEVWLAQRNRIPGEATPAEAALWDKLFAHLDRTPPFLDVWTNPRRLWPPSNQLVPVTVIVRATDDQDPHPTVKLVSVTCNDGCNPALDIADATYGVDDRYIQLRAERRVDDDHHGDHHDCDHDNNGNDRRVYTITYSAVDAAGNERVSSTNVCVAPGKSNEPCRVRQDRDRGRHDDHGHDDDHGGDDHDRDHGGDDRR